MSLISCAAKNTTIANGASLSAAVTLDENSPVGVLMPSAWTAANLTFQGSVDGTNWYNIYDEFGNEYTVVASTSRMVGLDYRKFIGANYVKVRSGTNASAVAQEAERVIGVVLRKVN